MLIIRFDVPELFYGLNWLKMRRRFGKSCRLHNRCFRKILRKSRLWDRQDLPKRQ